MSRTSAPLAPFPVPSALAALLALAPLGCDLGEIERGEGGVEQVSLNIATVPQEVRCIRVTATGAGRTLVREMEALPGAMFQKSLTGLPLGAVSFFGEAFTAACSDVTKTTTAGWVSEASVDVSIALGRSASVELVMVRNGRAKLDVSFSEEATCSPAGAACLSSAECCSSACVARKCAGGASGSADGGAPSPTPPDAG